MRLSDLCLAFPACTAVAYCDLTTGMVLAVGRQKKFPQEQIDQLAQSAIALLDSGVANLGVVQTVVVVQDGFVYLILRSAQEPTEALSCECGPDIDLEGFGRALCQAFSDIRLMA